MTMVRRIMMGLAVLFVANLAAAGDMTADGTVKSVSGSGFVVTDSAGKDWSFDVDTNTTVLVKGGSHKLAAVKDGGKVPQLSDFLSASKSVHVTYVTTNGKMVAKEVRVKNDKVS
jgi:hypothetical protein